MPDRSQCLVCGHQDWATEFYHQAIKGTDKVGTYCRNHNACHRRANTLRKKMTDTQFGEYAEPVSEEIEYDVYRPRDHYGNSAIVKVLEHKASVVTTNSPDGAPAVICDVYDLNQKKAFRQILMMTGAIVDGFRPHAGRNPIVIKWEKRKANNGRDYPVAVPAVEAAIEAAKAVYAAGDPFQQEFGKVAEEEAPY